MKTKKYFLILLLIFSCNSNKSLNVKPIFRYVDLYSYGKFELGDDIKKINSLIDIVNKRIFLKKNVFGGAESIEIILNSKEKISSIIFKYSSESNLQEEIKDYHYLGNPEIIGETAKWNDGNTAFELYKENDFVYSKMTDLKK